jgi:uncharacterized protein YggE
LVRRREHVRGNEKVKERAMRTNRVILVTIPTTTWTPPATVGVSQGTITITVTGEARGTPDMMCIELVSEAVAGNASDAFRQCKEKADAAAKAIEMLRIPDSQIAREMYEFSSPVPTDLLTSMRSSAVPAGMRVLQVLKVGIKMKGKPQADRVAETISRVFDAANKSGVSLRPTSRGPAEIFGEGSAQPVTYVLQDAGPLVKLATADAFRKANQIKEALVASGVTPGKTLSISYQQLGEMQEMMPWRRSARDKDVPDTNAALSVSPEWVSVRRSLVFTYGVERAEGR